MENSKGQQVYRNIAYVCLSLCNMMSCCSILVAQQAWSLYNQKNNKNGQRVYFVFVSKQKSRLDVHKQLTYINIMLISDLH